jgi:dienelactone hydrolase
MRRYLWPLLLFCACNPPVSHFNDAGHTNPGSDAGLDAGSVADAGSDAGVPLDAGVDAGANLDAGTDLDAGANLDAGVDAGVVPDAGTDAGTDAGSESSDAGVDLDAGLDAGTDAGAVTDAGVDAGADAGVDLDAGVDAGVDAGPIDAGPCVPNNNDGGPATIVALVDGGTHLSDVPTYVPIEFQFQGFSPCSEVTVNFRLDGDAGFQSWATFQASQQGRVSTLTDAPSTGTWTEVDVEGPFWSMEGPYAAVNGFDVRVDASDDTGRVAPEILVTRTETPDGVLVSNVSTSGLVGKLYRPSGAGPFPGLLTFGGSEGGIIGGEILAESAVGDGVAVLAVAYFDDTGLPATLDDVPLEYFQTALQVLKGYSFVRPDRIGVMGYSKGGEAALLVGANFTSDVDAVIAVVPSSYAWPAWNDWTNSSWTLGGAQVPFVPWSNAQPQIEYDDAGDELIYQNVMFADSLAQASATELAAAAIPVERIAGPVVLLAAADDGVWPSCDMASAAFDRLVDAGHTVTNPLDDYECYVGASHGMDPAIVGLPISTLLMEPLGNNQFYAFGGTARDSAHASLAARNRMLQVLEYLKR